jgi:N-alpha-acetyltransferase 10/11
MVETFGAQYVSLHVRVSNKAAIHLYTKTLGFDQDKTEASYYADGEDAYSMRLDLSTIREQIREKAEAESDEHEDEGEPVGEAGSKNLPVRGKDLKKVKVGRALGVQALVEKDESKHS